MIVAYFTENEKYLKKGDYRKDFDANSIAELVSNIKVKELVLIKAKSRDIFDFKYNNHIDGDFDFEIIEDDNSFNKQTIVEDLKSLHTGKKTYVCYSVKPELQDRIGKIVYLTKNKDIKEYIMKNSNDLAIEVSELKEFHNKVLKNDKGYIVKLMFDGSEVD